MAHGQPGGSGAGVIIYYSELPEAQPAAVVEVIIYDHFFLVRPGLF